ncbi:lipid asymmetry maintenance protein MlaB [Dactylosporangium siamense]|uniref:Sulfate transporter n=1 Tax=Dactylosporangium siamense TaxID=685454 RepID=A0A919PSH4_9ACTN|nr:STAS domain-containing protein [Dactylosporangium siamense]GIG49801.1 sulfate transporter [Dactylosporangium siamense]
MKDALIIDGELTVAVAAEQQARLRAFLERGTAADVDLSGVTELDTAGLQLLLVARREAAQRGITLTFHNPSRAVHDVFVMAHLDLDGAPR